MKKMLLCLLFVALSATGIAQDLHLSQFYMSPLTLNPALTGVFNGNYRLTGNYRNQWASVISHPFQTVGGAAELSLKSGEFNRLGIGINVLSDKAGTAELSSNIFSGSLAYTLGLSRNQDYYISAGLHVSYTQRSVNPLGIIFAQPQFIEHTGVSYADVGAGALWFHVNPRKKRSSQYFGASVFHVNQPVTTFMEGPVPSQLYRKFVVHGGMELPMSTKTSLTPYVLGMSQGPAFETELGTLFKFILDEKKGTPLGGTNFYIGGFYRIVGDEQSPVFSDAFIFASKLDIRGFTFGVSYDVNLSGLSPATSGRGGPELAVQYTGAFKHVSHQHFCPTPGQF